MVDLIVVGGGPSGISCAIEAKRRGLSVILAEKENIGGAVKYARKIENFPPFNSISGKELSKKLQDYFINSKIDFLPFEVKEINWQQNKKFILEMKNGKKVEAKSIYLATGQEDFIPEEYSSFVHLIKTPKSILQARQHSREILIYGGGDVAFDVALSLTDLQCNVMIACRSYIKAKNILQKEAKAKGIKILENFIVQNIRKEDNKIKVSLRNETRTIESIFDDVVFAVGKKPFMPKINLSLDVNLKKLIPSTIFHLNQIGIFLGGDLIRDKNRNVGVAVGDGITATFNINLFLKGKRI